MATEAEINALLDGAKCLFSCYDAPIQAEMQTYILALAAGVDPDPIQLAKDAKCINCLNNELLVRVRAYLFNELSSGPEDPQVLAEEIKCIQCYVPHGMLQSIDTWNFLNDPASPSTDPAVVANLARCFSCQSPVTLLQIQVYLLCQIIYQGECDLNSILFQARQNPVIDADPPVVTTDRIVVIRGGGGLRGCTDREADQVPVITGTYVAGLLTSIHVTVAQACCQQPRLALFQADDAAGAGAVPYDTKNIPAAYRGVAYSWDFTIGVAPTKPYFVVSQICKDTESVPSNGLLYSNPGSEWADRVEANGGARPSEASIAAVSTFITSTTAAGVWAKLHAVNVFAPDNLIAAITPVKVGPGNDPWTNHNFVAGDLSTTGLLGANTKYLETGVDAFSDMNTSTNAALVVYLPDANLIASLSGLIPLGEYRASDSTKNCLFQPKATFAANTSVAMIGGYQGGLNRHAQVAFPGNGYFCGSRTALGLISLYWANSLNPHALMDTGADASLGAYNPSWQYCMAGYEYDAAGPNRYYLAHVSFAALAQGLTIGESAALYAAVQALRTSFGGGYV